GGGQLVAGDLAGVSVRIEQFPSCLTVGLGPVQRDIRGAHQVVGVGTGDGPFDNPDARRNGQPAFVNMNRFTERGKHPIGDLDDVIGTDGVLDQHDELVTAQAGNQVPQLGGDPVQPLGEGDQHLVTDVMAEAVVDGLESVQVDKAQSDPGA